ncbi:NAD-dependent succinate-semialdehyde dehydrogenase [Ferrovibrio sp. MS7]|uniref:NAD-dependent succinate-semialdehyde dehydrogenase n=1 Tax=Ferrovibrio plantarum TaxID=3119164 RepID=UPI00313603CC
MYTNIQLQIAGQWVGGAAGATIQILNPATGEAIGTVAKAEKADLDRALAAAEAGFRVWKKVSGFDRYKILRKAADLLRARAEAIAQNMTLEQGKPLAEARMEANAAGDIVDWFAEEARRTYGRVIPARVESVQQLVIKEPVGPVAAFTPWNFPINQAVRKVSAALAAGCSIILKGPEETPAACAALVQAYLDAGVPEGVVQLVYGVPSEISEYLIPHPVIRKITFTGSTPVGKHLSMLAGAHMKRITMELGGHSPAIVCEDADIDRAVALLSAAKFRNAGQVCTSPTRFLVHESAYERFVAGFVQVAKGLKVGDGMDKDTQMGPLANDRRVQAMEMFVSDAVSKGAKIQAGGKRIGNKGNFFEPTVMTEVPLDARIMNEEPFGPVVPILPFRDLDAALVEANRLPYGLAAYAYTRSSNTIATLSAGFESGMVSVNHHGLALPEAPFGGVKDSGYGSEGGIEAMEAYLNAKFVTLAAS